MCVTPSLSQVPEQAIVQTSDRVRQKILAVCVLMVVVAARPVSALPIFAERYSFTCQACHTTVPQLNSFGQAFLRAGFRIPNLAPNARVFPVAVKVNLAYSSAVDPSGLPKIVLDELEFLTGASLGKNFSYRLEQYGLDGGRPGLMRDAWVRFTSNPTLTERSALRVVAGQFTLPLPIDPETMRESLQHYAVFDQSVGGNAFTFFDPKIGVDLALGNEVEGVDGHVVVMQGHDRQSGMPALGLDRMFSTQ